MAEALARRERTPEVSQAQFLEFLDRYAAQDRYVEEAVADRKELRAEIKAAGIPLAAFDRARRDADASGEVREEIELWYRRLMAWLQKPVGFQASMDFAADGSGTAALSVHDLKTIDNAGYEAGKGGRRRDSCSYTPGTEAAQRWDQAWLRGQSELADALSDAPPKRGRGRPPGSKNRPRLVAPDESAGIGAAD